MQFSRRPADVRQEAIVECTAPRPKIIDWLQFSRKNRSDDYRDARADHWHFDYNGRFDQNPEMTKMKREPTMQRLIMAAAFFGVSVLASSIMAQETSVRPGVNDSFRDPKVSEFQEKFEIESREVFAKRKEIVKVCKVAPGMTVADIGAGTGVFTRLFSDAVGPKGQVLAVDIAPNFLEHINNTNREAGRKNVQTVACTPESTKLESATVDVAYICDTYHHFEFPFKTMSSLHAALKPGGRLFVVDFKRVEGESTDWTMNHVRAGQEVFEAEILSCGFKKTGEHSGLLKENYFIEFERIEPTK